MEKFLNDKNNSALVHKKNGAKTHADPFASSVERELASLTLSLNDQTGQANSAALTANQEVTSRKQTEDRLRQVEILNRELGDRINEILYTHDFAGNILSVNRAMEEMLGYSRQEAIELNVSQIIASEYLPPEHFVRSAEDSRENEAAYDLEFMTKSGQRIPVKVRSRVIYDGTQPLMVQSIAQDLSENNRTQDALTKSEARYRQLIETAQEGIWEINANSDTTFVNTEMARMVGYPSEEMKGKSIFKFMDASSKAIATAKIEELRTGIAGQFDFKFQRKGGGDVWAKVSAQPLFDKGRYDGAIAMMVDHTQFKQVNETLHRREALEQVIHSIHTTAVHASADIYQAFHVALDRTLDLLALKKGIVWLSLPPSKDLLILRDLPESSGKAIVDASAKAGPQPKATANDWSRVTGPMADTMRKLKIGGSILMPLTVFSKRQGAIAVFSESPREWSTEDYEFLESVGLVLNLIAERASLYEETHRHLLELETLDRISVLLHSAQTVDEMLPLLIDEALSSVGADSASIWLDQTPDGLLQEQASRGCFRQASRTPIKPTEGIVGQVFSTGRSHVTREFSSDPRTPGTLRRDIPRGIGGVCVPIRSANKIIGFMFVAVQLPREITEHEVNLLATLAGIAGDAIHRARLRESLESTYEMTLGGWARALDIRVKEGEGHNQRVAEMAWKLAYAMGIGKDELVHIRRGAILHDIGKLVLPDNVLLKDGPLSQEEWKIMLQHPEFGRDLLNRVEYLKPALDIPYCHHEKWDGTGYPRGLQGEEIPLAARIFAIVDVWDTMMLDRTYRSKFLPEKAIQYIREQAGKHFDPEVVRMFLKLINGDQRRP